MTQKFYHPSAIVHGCEMWSAEAVVEMINAAVRAERDVCAMACQDQAMKCGYEAQKADADGEHDKSVSLRATARHLTVCESAIKARGKQ